MENIDKSTIPFCLVEQKKFDWGEPYTTHDPIFKITPANEVFSLEDSIIILGENNFKTQLLSLYNVITNYEELERIKNYNGEEFDRGKILELINFYILENKDNVTPWEKYNGNTSELIYISYVESKAKRKLHFIDYEE